MTDRHAPPLPAILILAGTLAAYAAMATYAALYGRTWLDEITYIVKSWWYTTGVLRPYSDEDATWYMPLYFYQLGWAQHLFGQGHIVGRAMSIVLGVLSGGLVFLICRRLNLSATLAAMAVALYLLTPTTVYYFAGATPIATVAFLLLLAVYIVVTSVGKPRPLVSVALGLLFGMVFFYRQNAILAAVVLAPVYLYVIGGRRAANGALLAVSAAAVSAVILALFPEKLALYAIRLPLLTPLLQSLNLLPDSLRLIEDATDSSYSLRLDPAALSWRDPVNGFVLPYLGTILLALAVFAVHRSKRFLMLVPALFFFLAATHYLGSAGYCPVCILTYTNYFVGIGAVAAALTLDFVWQWCVKTGRPALPVVLALGAGAVALNVFGTSLATPDVLGRPSPYRYFPMPMVSRSEGLADLEVSARLARIVARITPAGAKVLVLDDQPALAYAAFVTGHMVPVQSFNLRQSFRRLRPGLADDVRAQAIQRLEAESLWSDDTVLRWLNDDSISVVMLQANAVQLSPEARGRLEARYRQTANVIVLGRNVEIYARKGQ